MNFSQLTILGFLITSLAAWFTNLFWVVSTFAKPIEPTVGQIVLGVLSVFLPPVGVVHGFAIWFGMGS